MKQNNLLIVLVIVLIAFLGCKKEGNKQPPISKSYPEEIVSYKNSLNPYDSVGMIHNDICYSIIKTLTNNGCVLTDGGTDTIVSFHKFLSKEYNNEKWQISINSIVSLVDDYLYLNGYASSENALSDIFDENYLNIVQRTTNLNDSVAFFLCASSLFGTSLNSDFLSECARLVYNESNTLSSRYLQSKDIESIIIAKPYFSNEDIMQLIGLSVYRHSTHLWNDINNPSLPETAAPPWVASDLTGAMNAWGYGCALGGWLGWGFIAGYAALCSTVSALLTAD
ncbi:MAG: hypothetical protein LBM67_04010 [Lentimicrobiaceae bacterium]|jgi:hypothetical protein|nr:hypothetical protein [Lentimicrobiaceae bacterium]